MWKRELNGEYRWIDEQDIRRDREIKRQVWLQSLNKKAKGKK